jgi:phage terminase Nu1 subunit (DNA packaging protein)
MTKRLKAAGYEIERGRKWTAREVFTACLGDPVLARTRRAMAEADVLELKAGQMRGELVSREAVQVMVSGWLLPIREALVSMPDEMSARVNPPDPIHARAQLVEWRDRTMRVLGGSK